MSERRWIQSGDIWKTSYINDKPPSGLNEIVDRISSLVDDADQKGVEIFVGGKKLLEVNCVYKVKEPT